jgi:histidinol-phosphatase (PHP family)
MEMYLAASENQLQYIGISEHVYQLQETRAQMGDFFLEGMVYSLEEYFQILQSLQEENLHVLRGVELDYLPELMPRVCQILKEYPFDYVIGAVHELDDWDIHTYRGKSDISPVQLWLKYFDAQFDLLDRGCIQILAHPLRLAVTEKVIALGVEERLNDLVQRAVEMGVAIEINAKDIILAPSLVRGLMQACHRHKAMITTGTDAHYPEEIGRGIATLQTFLGTEDLERAVIFINQVSVPVSGL